MIVKTYIVNKFNRVVLHDDGRIQSITGLDGTGDYFGGHTLAGAMDFSHINVDWRKDSRAWDFYISTCREMEVAG